MADADARIGVCSWSLQPENPRQLAERVAECGVSLVQLHLDPVRTGAWDAKETIAALHDAGARLCSGMMTTEGEDYSTLESIKLTGGVRPDATWAANLSAAKQNAELAASLGLQLVTLHAGFLPHEKGDPERAKLVDRLGEVVDVFAERGVRVGLETGQESAETLLEVLEEVGREDWLGVNFDPANMILYRMGYPIDAIRLLAPRVQQIHIKDAILSEREGEWGEEVVVGTGRVDWEGFFSVVSEAGIDCDFVIEREAGEARVADVRTARTLVRPLVASTLKAVD